MAADLAGGWQCAFLESTVRDLRGSETEEPRGENMKGDAEVIKALNEILTAELTAINQYFIHSRMCGNWGYRRLAAKKREESIGEMRDAETLIDRGPESLCREIAAEIRRECALSDEERKN